MSTDDVLDHQLWAAGDGEYPDRLDLSALAARLLCEQQAVTARWASWAEEVVSGWDEPSGTDATWGIQTLRASGKGFPIVEDPAQPAALNAFRAGR